MVRDEVASLKEDLANERGKRLDLLEDLLYLRVDYQNHVSANQAQLAALEAQHEASVTRMRAQFAQDLAQIEAASQRQVEAQQAMLAEAQKVWEEETAAVASLLWECQAAIVGRVVPSPCMTPSTLAPDEEEVSEDSVPMLATFSDPPLVEAKEWGASCLKAAAKRLRSKILEGLAEDKFRPVHRSYQNFEDLDSPPIRTSFERRRTLSELIDFFEQPSQVAELEHYA